MNQVVLTNPTQKQDISFIPSIHIDTSVMESFCMSSPHGRQTKQTNGREIISEFIIHSNPLREVKRKDECLAITPHGKAENKEAKDKRK
jgi:hypothetical protein